MFLWMSNPILSQDTGDAYSEACEGVTTLSWQKQIITPSDEYNAARAGEIREALEMDARESSMLSQGWKLKGTVTSHLASVINKYMSDSQSVSDEFWEQSVRFTETMCFLLTLMDRSDLSNTMRQNLENNLQSVINSRSDYLTNLNFVGNKTIEVIEVDEDQVRLSIANYFDDPYSISITDIDILRRYIIQYETEPSFDRGLNSDGFVKDIELSIVNDPEIDGNLQTIPFNETNTSCQLKSGDHVYIKLRFNIQDYLQDGLAYIEANSTGRAIGFRVDHAVRIISYGPEIQKNSENGTSIVTKADTIIIQIPDLSYKF